MKRVIGLVLIFVLLFSLSACKEEYKKQTVTEEPINELLEESEGDDNQTLEEEVKQLLEEQEIDLPEEIVEEPVEEIEEVPEEPEKVLNLEEIDSYFSMADYPNFLDHIKTRIVLGEDASTKEIAAATDIQLALQTEGNEAYKISVNEVENFLSYDLIVIGTPCVNPLVNEAFGLAEDKCTAFREGTARLRLFTLDGKEVVVLTGKTSEDIYKASPLLVNLGGYIMSGKAITVDTSGATPMIQSYS